MASTRASGGKRNSVKPGAKSIRARKSAYPNAIIPKPTSIATGTEITLEGGFDPSPIESIQGTSGFEGWGEG